MRPIQITMKKTVITELARFWRKDLPIFCFLFSQKNFSPLNLKTKIRIVALGHGSKNFFDVSSFLYCVVDCKFCNIKHITLQNISFPPYSRSWLQKYQNQGTTFFTFKSTTYVMSFILSLLVKNRD